MKIGIFFIPEISLGKHNIQDSRLDQLYQLVKSPKKTYAQVELVSDEGVLKADAIVTLKDSVADLLLQDMEFIQTRLARAVDKEEKQLLKKIEDALEKEEFVFKLDFLESERQTMSSYSLYTHRPITIAQRQELENLDQALLLRCLKESGYISFFTTGEKETRAWLLKKGATAWEAAGNIHSDIQKGFIRAEIISLADFMECGGETQAKQAGKMRLESKEYLMQDADIAKFRFNK